MSSSPDRGFDSDDYRAAFEDKGIAPRISPRKTRKFQHAYDRALHKLHYREGQNIGRLKLRLLGIIK